MNTRNHIGNEMNRHQLGISPEELDKATERYLVELLARHTKVPEADLRVTAPFERFGVQSIMMLQMTQELERDLGPLPKTLFFEHSNVKELAAHLVVAREKALRKHLGLEPQEVQPPVPSVADTVVEPTRVECTSSQNLEVRGGKDSRRREVTARPEGAGKLRLLRRWQADEQNPHAWSGSSRATEPVAIIGMSGRYPGASDLDEFWRNLAAGRDCVTPVPRRRWNHEALLVDGAPEPGRTYCNAGGFVEGIEFFDPMFFRMPPKEAAVIDPQERLFLETAWHTLEDAGYTRASLAHEKVGVFVGMMLSQYQLLSSSRSGWCNGGAIPASVANRVSHFFDFTGPSLTLDTMCSSSLTALHLACDALVSGDATVALVGGVNLMVHPAKYLALSQYTFLSATGHCHAFGAAGDGYVPGEGVGAVLIKPLSRAVADGDHIHAVLLASAVNQAGHTNAYYVPSPKAQAEVITEALRRAQVDAGDVSYVEAHGTGTQLGDPIEISGLERAYGSAETRSKIALGSVKSGIGHLESAAGMAALTKVVLQMTNGQLAPSLHCTPPNPNLNLDASGFEIPRTLAPWKPRRGRRVAGISAFGAGGSNAHLIVAEAPATQMRASVTGPELLVFSARDEPALRALAQRWLRFLGDPVPAQDTRLVREAVAAVVGVPCDAVGDTDRFEDLGLSGYLVHECATHLAAATGCPVSADLLLDNQTVQETAAVLRSVEAGPTLAGGPDVELADIAHTLQVGREEMVARLAFVAEDLDSVRSRLAEYLAGGTSGIQIGNLEQGSMTVLDMIPDDLVSGLVSDLIDRGRLDELAALWVAGLHVDWSRVRRGGSARRVSLPTYPFRRDLCWITDADVADALVPDSVISDILGEAVPSEPSTSSPAPMPRPASAELTLESVVFECVADCLVEVLGVPRERIVGSLRLENLGMDSVRITQVLAALSRHIEQLPATLLFTCKDIDGIVRFLVANHREACTWLLMRRMDVGNILLDDSPANDVPPSPANDMSPSPAVTSTSDPLDIAIVGVSGRYPGAPDLATFARNLREATDCVSEIPKERWDWRQHPDIKCRWGGFIDDALTFDPTFFGIAPNTAAFMDPQERLFIQAAWHCLEDAGYTPQSLGDPRAGDGRGNVGVFVGASFNDYALHGADALQAGQVVPVDQQMYSVANRVSYLFNLRGPSLVVDTACSSSLYAIHLAARAIRNGECDVAIAGGVNLLLHPAKYSSLNLLGFLAPDGHCHSFGADGGGYVPGEGVGAVLLKPLERALADRDHIYGVIRGSSVNHGGRTQGYTVPNPVAQAELVSNAMALAGVTSESIGYVEAHGTGTTLGDPIEIDALTRAFGNRNATSPRCALGSVKSLIGHPEAAAGISQLTKVLLQLGSREIFPHRLNSEQLNPNLNLGPTPFRIPAELEEWPAPTGPSGEPLPRRAGISSFGVGGLSAHLVIEEAPAASPRGPKAAGPRVVLLSAASPEQLRRAVDELHTYLAGGHAASFAGVPSLEDVAFTLRVGRVPQKYRLALVAEDLLDLNRQLGSASADGQVGFWGEVAPGRQAATVGTRPRTAQELKAFARAWVTGEAQPGPDWLEHAEARRVSLPGYPFAGKDYWLYGSGPAENAQTDQKYEFSAAPPIEPPAVADDVPPEVDRPDFLVGWEERPSIDRLELLIDHVRTKFETALGFGGGDILDIDRGLFDLGLDSITAANVFNTLEAEFGTGMDQSLFFNYPTVRQVADYLVAWITAADAPATTRELSGNGSADDLVDVDLLDEDELVQVLQQELIEATLV